MRANGLPVNHFIRQFLCMDNEFNMITPIQLEWSHSDNQGGLGGCWHSRSKGALKTNAFTIAYPDGMGWAKNPCTLKSWQLQNKTIQVNFVDNAKSKAQDMLDDYVMNYVDFSHDTLVVV